MPAPTSSALRSQIISMMGPKTTGSAAWNSFATALCNEISSEWAKWISNTIYGEVIVTGAGNGSWTGAGNGGAVTSPTYSIDPEAVFSGAGFTVQTVGTLKFLNSLNSVLGQKFAIWSSSYRFASAPYAGTSTSTGASSGTFNAIIVPTPLATAGNGTNPSGIQSAWESILTSGADPIFKLDNEFCYTRIFTSAVSSTIEQQFAQSFLTGTEATTNSVTGSAASGSGNGTATSLNDGIIV